jgi:hypothetical protein
MKKITLIALILFLCVSVGYTQKGSTQKADNRIHTLFANQDFFTLQKEYPRLKKSASEQGLLYMEFYLNSYFNKPEKAMENVELVAKNVSSWLNGDEQLKVACLIADNSAKMQNYTNAASVYEQLVEQLSLYWDSNWLRPYQEMAQFYNILKKASPMEVIYPEQVTIPLNQDSAGLFTMKVYSFDSESTKFDFVMDFGANFSMVEEQYIQDLKIKIIADSVIVKGGSGVSVYSKIGIAEELYIEEIKLKNVPFLVVNEILDLELEHDTTFHQLTNYKIKGIIGYHVLQAFEHLTIEKTKLTVSKSFDKHRQMPNMINFNYLSYIHVTSSKNSLLMLFDSGLFESELHSNYLLKNPKENQNLPVDSIRKAHFGGVQMFEYYKKENFQCKIGNKKIYFSDINIYNDLDISPILIDGIIGRDIILNNKQIIIDFKNMYFDVK